MDHLIFEGEGGWAILPLHEFFLAPILVYEFSSSLHEYCLALWPDKNSSLRIIFDFKALLERFFQTDQISNCPSFRASIRAKL